MLTIGSKIKKKLSNLFKSESGGIITTTAVAMPVLIGFAGVGMDMTNWYLEKRDLQNMADSGSIMGAHSYEYGQSVNDLTTIISDHIAAQGYDSSEDTITVSNPPTSGRAAGLDGYVEVTISRPAQTIFISYFGLNDLMVSARAVAGKVTVGEQCILALDHDIDRALEFSGTADVQADCGVAANSSSEEAIYIGGRASLTADPAQAFGDLLVSGSGSLITNSPVQSFSLRVDDPYGAEGRNLQVPAGSSCDFSSTNAGNNDTLSPGRYCGDLTIQGSNVVLSPGTYIIDGGDFITNGGAEFSGHGVTIILTGNSSSDVGIIRMNGGTVADLTAPTTGDYEGILFYQDQNATELGGNNIFNGGSDLLLDGAIYFPQQEITFTGGSTLDPSCVQIVGKKVTFVGNSVIRNDDSVCTALNMEEIKQERVQLVE